MRVRRTIALFFVFLALISQGAFAESRQAPPPQVQSPEQDSTWKRLKERDGVTIFLRERHGSTIKEGLGRGMIDAPPCRVTQIPMDLDRLVDFMPYLKARIVTDAGPDWENLCEYLDFPWPIWDRLINLRVDRIRDYRNNHCEYFEYWRKDETIACTVSEVKNIYANAEPDPVIPPTNEGYWHLVPHEGGTKTLATYYVFTEAGGSIPNWLTNVFVDDAILRLFQAVRGRAGQSGLYLPCACPEP